MGTCEHPTKTTYRDPQTGQAVQQCCWCGTELDRGDPEDFWRGMR